ncbi:MAG: rhodanese-like domain-containing protein [Vicinamibacterales bacterium]
MPVSRTTKEELKALLESADPDSKPVLIDARLKYPYEHSGLTLPGALRMEPDRLEFDKVPPGKPVVVYDSDPKELVSSRVAAAFLRRGFQASALKGGIAEWISANFPVEPKPRAGGTPTAG